MNDKLKEMELAKVDGSNLERPYYYKTVYKYQKTSTALKCLGKDGKGTLRFSEPSEWNDPTEKTFYSVLGGKKGAPIVYAACVTNKQLSEASWITYQYGSNEGCVKFSIDFLELLMQIEIWASEHNYTFYIGKAYNRTWKELKNVGKKDENCLYKIVFKGSSLLEDSLRLLLLKRDGFDYEREIRLFLVKKGVTEAANGKTEKYVDVNIDWKPCLRWVYYSEDCKYIDIQRLKQICSNIKKGVTRRTIYVEHEVNPVQWPDYCNNANHLINEYEHD